LYDPLPLSLRGAMKRQEGQALALLAELAEQRPYLQDFLPDRLPSGGRVRCAGLSLNAACVPEHVYVQWASLQASTRKYRHGLFRKQVRRNTETTLERKNRGGQ